MVAGLMVVVGLVVACVIGLGVTAADDGLPCISSPSFPNLECKKIKVSEKEREKFLNCFVYQDCRIQDPGILNGKMIYTEMIRFTVLI